jgi:hypothetical protein
VEEKNMSGPSSIKSLQRLAHVSDVEAAAVFGAVGRQELLDGVMRTTVGRGRGARGRHGTRGRRPLVLALAGAALIAVATAATWAILRSTAHETTSIECVIAGTDTIVPAVSGDPAYDCAVVWQNDLGTVPPPLAAYDNGDGGVTVIPRADKPGAGWTRLAGDQNVALIQLQESLDDYIAGLNSSCLSAKAATTLTEGRLARFGFTGWTVTVRDQGACANADVVDPASRTVTLIPSGAAAGPKTTVQKLADKLRAVMRSCESLPAATASARAAAASLGLSETARTYELQAITDDSLRCASIYETVGGTIFVTVRGATR